jgi:GGDEF domain-containing protein
VEGSVCARLGGEEFLVITVSDPEHSFTLADGLLKSIFDPTDRPPITASVGYAICSLASDENDSVTVLQELTNRADAAMYTAKRQGGDRVIRSAG